MSSVNVKDFKVKNGLRVALDAVVTGTLESSDPVDGGHAATKRYVDSRVFAVVDESAPTSPFAGQMWVDPDTGRMSVYSGYSWITLATVDDANTLQDHIHNDAIEGNGRIATIL